ncbi:MAG: hypothetical protein AAFV51_04460, partial [Pseudomonadota bacterium]
MANNILKRLLGGDPAGVAIRLVIASVVVGFILAAVGANPVDLWKGLFRRIGDTFEAAVDNFGSVTTTLVSYLALGAVLVVPTWFVWRLATPAG